MVPHLHLRSILTTLGYNADAQVKFSNNSSELHIIEEAEMLPTLYQNLRAKTFNTIHVFAEK